MALQSSGQIKISEIATELEAGSEPNLSLKGLEGGLFATINTNSAATPDGEEPYAMSEWYSYDHSASPAYSNTRYYQNDGTGDYINCTTSTSPFSINTTQDLSFSMWVRHTGSKQNQLVFNFGNTNSNGNNRIFMTYSASLNRMILRVRTNSVNFDRQFPLHDNSSATGISSSTSGWSSTSRGSVNSDNFCMLTMTYDASQTNAANAFKFYWNASECTTQSNANSGTRTGITSISEICLALNCFYHVQNNWKLNKLPQISHTVSEYSGIKIPPNAPIVGENAFLHKAGLHVSAVLNNPNHYEIFPAELVGQKRDIVLDKMASKHTVKKKLEEMEIEADNDSIQKIINYAKLKEKGTVSENEIFDIFTNYRTANIMFQ